MVNTTSSTGLPGHLTNINGRGYWILTNGTAYTYGGSAPNCTVQVCPVTLSIYGYRPLLSASYALIALYIVCMLLQLGLGIVYKTWSYMTYIVIGCVVELLGYVGRVLYWQNPWGKAGFIMQIVLITIGPVFFSAAVYIQCAAIVRYLSPQSSRFDPKFYTWIFIPCDIISLILQALGGALSSTSNGSNKSGVTISLAGLGFQVGTLVIFSAIVVDYLIRSRSVWSQTQLPRRSKLFCGFIAAATLFILIRCCYRLYELKDGYSKDSEALRDEPLFIGLESVMILLAAYSLTFGHPGPVFRRRGNPVEEKQEQ